MRAAILGGGFGLYGYLPALVRCGATVVLPRKYYDRVLGRAELAPLVGEVEWREEDRLLEGCEAAIIALPPAQQPAAVTACIGHSGITHLLLEKPLTATPGQAIALLAQLQSSGRRVRIGYNFRFTPWGRVLLEQEGGADTLRWNFKAHHFANDIQSWKRRHAEGGGSLRFYGIHLIALLAELGYTEVLDAQLSPEAEQWRSVFAGPGLRECHVLVDSNSDDTEFFVEAGEDNLSMNQPFETDMPTSDEDQRVPFLVEGLTGLFEEPDISYRWYETANRLWQDVEAKL